MALVVKQVWAATKCSRQYKEASKGWIRNEDQYQADLNTNPPAEEATLQEKNEALNNLALMEDDSKWAQTWSDDRSG